MGRCFARNIATSAEIVLDITCSRWGDESLNLTPQQVTVSCATEWLRPILGGSCLFSNKCIVVKTFVVTIYSLINLASRCFIIFGRAVLHAKAENQACCGEHGLVLNFVDAKFFFLGPLWGARTCFCRREFFLLRPEQRGVY